VQNVGGNFISFVFPLSHLLSHARAPRRVLSLQSRLAVRGHTCSFLLSRERAHTKRTHAKRERETEREKEEDGKRPS